MIGASGEITLAVKIQYLHILLLENALHEFETLLGQIGHTTNANLNYIIFVPVAHFFFMNALPEKMHGPPRSEEVMQI